MASMKWSINPCQVQDKNLFSTCFACLHLIAREQWQSINPSLVILLRKCFVAACGQNIRKKRHLFRWDFLFVCLDISKWIVLEENQWYVSLQNKWMHCSVLYQLISALSWLPATTRHSAWRCRKWQIASTRHAISKILNTHIMFQEVQMGACMETRGLCESDVWISFWVHLCLKLKVLVYGLVLAVTAVTTLQASHLVDVGQRMGIKNGSWLVNLLVTLGY